MWPTNVIRKLRSWFKIPFAHSGRREEADPRPKSAHVLTFSRSHSSCFLMAALLASPVCAQTPGPADFDAFAREVEVWARDNLDEDVLHILDQVDRDRVRELFTELNKSLGNDNVYDLAPLKEAA